MTPRTETSTGWDPALTGRALEPAYQRIVSLEDGATVGFEALARWPSVSGADPLSVFDSAAAAGEVDALDRSCIDAAIAGALDGQLARGTMLAVNCEPTTRHVAVADSQMLARGHAELDLIFELTERGLLAHPRALLDKVAALRIDGFAIALDDVGSHPDSLALLDVVDPDVIKLDLRLVQSQPDREQARILAAVLAHHERAGAVILAEGIETAEHLEQALSIGATLGQGYRFGHPGPLEEGAPARWGRRPRAPFTEPGAESPLEQLAAAGRLRTARKATLTAFSRHIESQATRSADPPIVLSALQRVDQFTSGTRRRYRELARTSPLVAVFGEDMPSDVVDGIRGVPLDPDDPMCTEWIVVALGAHTAAALIARERDGSGSITEADRRFDYTITYDRALVTATAHYLLDRML
ncbi:EAL domain-containing protein [Mycobacterium yunnanensis]|uniref:EAL domain-containing protein n=1 Tax=Mycobacterium yunnanensis TaxID=368477 RepID=A0A9X2YNN7_9MYCO|nr:EAL domain-containing protein [Mycobacterium yunnanensis]MCV7422683.1 EAL domain-containing protein [Mycobacterium yunnanensis]